MPTEAIGKKSRKIKDIHARFQGELAELAKKRRALIADLVKRIEAEKMDEIRKQIGI